MTFLGGDDMVMRLRLKHERNSPRERAAEERREHQEKRKRRRATRLLRRARYAAHGAKLGKKRRRGPRRLKAKKFSWQIRTAKVTAKIVGGTVARLIPFLGWALLANDAALLYHDWGRRISGGLSARLVQLQDNHVTMGDFIPQATAAAVALDYVESDAGRLRAIGNEGKMNATLASNVEVIRQLAYERAVGADMIRRDSHFDSADSFMDKIFAQADRAELKSTFDRIAHLIRTERASKGKGK